MSIITDAESNLYSVPPGILGAIAQFIYSSAPRPVPAIALAGAIGLMSGIVGRAYNISGTGLNQYLLLLAPTGTGKEAIANGTTSIMRAIEEQAPDSKAFIGPASIASPQALVKYLANTSASFTSIIGEFGLTMQQMANPKAPAHLVGLRALMLDLYAKSGRDGQLRPSIYSDREKNTVAVRSPAFSIVGESTPESFYEGLSERLISDGLLPRFSIIEYRGPRPPLQQDRTLAPSDELTKAMSMLCSASSALIRNNHAVDVQQTAIANRIFKDFDQQCDHIINSADREITRHLWNRAHIKVLKLAALVAVGVDPYAPVITEEHAMWAIQIEKHGIENISTRFSSGEIGAQEDSQTTQQTRIREVIYQWITKPWAELSGYKIGSEAMHRDLVIPYSYLSKRLTNDAAFKLAKIGATFAVKRTLDELFKCGELVRLSAKDVQERYDTRMECYMISDPEQFLHRV